MRGGRKREILVLLVFFATTGAKRIPKQKSTGSVEGDDHAAEVFYHSVHVRQ